MGKLFLTLLVLDKFQRLLKELAPTRKTICSSLDRTLNLSGQGESFPKSYVTRRTGTNSKKIDTVLFVRCPKLPCHIVVSDVNAKMQDLFIFTKTEMECGEFRNRRHRKKQSIPTYPSQISLCFLCSHMKKFENKENHVFKVLAKCYSSTKKERKKYHVCQHMHECVCINMFVYRNIVSGLSKQFLALFRNHCIFNSSFSEANF